MTATLSFRGVSVELGGRRVVTGLDLEVAPGRMTALVGPNGAGKTTALRAGMGLEAATEGEVLLGGRPVAAWKPRDLARVMAWVPQTPVLPPLFPVRSIVALGRTPYLGLLANESERDWAIVEAAMVATGVTEFADRRVGELSGGEQQRVVLARTLAQEPQVLLLDEPTANLDLRYQASTLELVSGFVRDRGLACLVVLHDLTLAAQFCDWMVVLADGAPRYAGPPGDVLTPAHLDPLYETPLRRLLHPDTGTPVIVHARRGGA